ncbi:MULTISPECIES: lactococcin 972 family bacteriocin [Brochothrix]|uniref:Lactococcin 972 family bacteriocin n=3 Tax=Brochothrix thermosphacta TaxID=2756 RepID=A0A2X0QG53_BROTH|nr:MULTISPECIES: lactococcin 972 family bacteriocin [Brochothrix]ANZ94226.1 hypothetical protein BFC19_01650 [Brochothrix thermosphacta]EUJ37707.1 hypothetical protein BTHER_04064 [Brochothrix thermosphacta DSM 20171 = FSL F6-1036]ODJ48826.1 hypothetical protein BFR34_08115 [Brochothrix thermosphacta DSM 20171 = FSL F6-1036]ODJ50010.1 hypothetical protein BFR38_04380 [Brochothrix thermosphacta]ODJ60326.1 hypothetical protein BFR44_04635 [Brochothrix thermosphacta]
MLVQKVSRTGRCIRILSIFTLTFSLFAAMPLNAKALDAQGSDMARVASGPKDGGYWIRGYKWAWPLEQVVSEYKHYTKRSHGSVVNGNGTYNSGGWTKSKNRFSRATANWTPWGTNKAYYDSTK